MSTLTPEVLWAQSDDKVFLTVNLADINEPTIELTEAKLSFATTLKDGKKYAFEVEFNKPIANETSLTHKTARDMLFTLFKKENSWWPRLGKNKLNFVKTDFNRWKDEDEEDEEEQQQQQPMDMGGMGGMGGMDFQQMMASMGAGGMGADMGDSDDDLPDNEDDNEVPPLEEADK